MRPAPGAAWDVVVGHSLGGATVAGALGTDARWARSAVLVDPALRLASPHTDELIAGMSAEAETPDAQRIAAGNPDWHPEDVHQKVLAARQISRDTVRRVFVDNDPWDVTAGVTGSAVPVSLLGADASAPDLALPPALGRELAAANPLVSYDEIAGAHHSIHRTHPGAVVEAVLARLA
ncbi:hypothetical protein AX769_16110 [Frondihabitans sp. PAMC 28766]|uniref:alpha/beta fold hydrolase n=1 Tax=Frondihabitans sp. PAMC 28766 TaxID=1795630 RepID=UPI00078CF61A|nr:alpha/beta hydrolase [Frondihabitans sp. PAMC 28766]AMM21376.1 hypothetical protein AX769_16110 [Frondihabitans sp. PAMC 28766]